MSLLIGAIFMVAFGAPLSSPGAEAVATANSWPMFRGNPGLTGNSPAHLPDAPALLWNFKTKGPSKSSAAISGGRVFIGSDDQYLYCLNAATGKKNWEFKTGGEVESSPLVLADRVFVGSNDGMLYAVDAASGKQIWKFTTENKIPGAPNWVKSPDGKSTWILFGSYDYKLYCVDAGNGKTNWSYETGNYINGSPAVGNGMTVFGGCDALLHVLSLADGQKIREIDAGSQIAGSGALESDQFFIGQYENVFLCADLKGGEIRWRYKDRAFPYFSSPALTKEFVVFGGRDKKLHCARRENGEEVWAFATQGKVDSSPVICGNKIVVGSDDGRVYIVDLATGRQLWNYEIGQAITSSPAVIDNLIVVGSDDGNVYAFGPKKGRK